MTAPPAVRYDLMMLVNRRHMGDEKYVDERDYLVLETKYREVLKMLRDIRHNLDDDPLRAFPKTVAWIDAFLARSG